jgi:hypothetical protein
VTQINRRLKPPPYPIVGALVVVVAVLGYQLYQDRKEPKGVQLNIGPSGVSIEKK